MHGQMLRPYFEWDETNELEEKGAIATPYEKGAVRVIAVTLPGPTTR